MIILIDGIVTDLSGYIERSGFKVSSTMGRRIDTATFTIFDPDSLIAIRPRAEIVVYDAPPGTAVVNPVTNRWDIIPTPRLFAGFLATPNYTLSGAQRQCQVDAQDYTCRLKLTVVNRDYSGLYDDEIVRDLFALYRPEVDTTDVLRTLSEVFPPITMATHTLDQAMERICKITGATYRIDYYNRLHYGPLGTTMAPFDISDDPTYGYVDTRGSALAPGWLSGGTVPPPGRPSIGCEDLSYAPDGSQFFDRCWVIGARFRGVQQNFQITVSGGGGQQFVFPLPAAIADIKAATLRVAAAVLGPSTSLALTATTDSQTNFPLPAAIADLASTEITIPLATMPPSSITILGSQIGIAGLDGNVSDAPIGVPTPPTRNDWVKDAIYQESPPMLALRNGVDSGTILTVVTRLVVGTGLGTPVDVGLVGTLGVDGQVSDDPATRAAWKFAALIGESPPTLALRTPPSMGSVLTLNAQFTYPLVAVVSDPALTADVGGLVFEKVIRDKRVDSLELANAIGLSAIHLQGAKRKGGSCVIRHRGFGGTLLEPGHVMTITNQKLLIGLLDDPTATHATFVVNRLELTLDDDLEQPYSLAVTFADRVDQQDTDLFDHLVTEQQRVNASLDQGNIGDITTDFQLLTDTFGIGDDTVMAVDTSTEHSRWRTFVWGAKPWGA